MKKASIVAVSLFCSLCSVTAFAGTGVFDIEVRVLKIPAKCPVNVRKMPGVNSEILTSVSNGERLTIAG